MSKKTIIKYKILVKKQRNAKKTYKETMKLCTARDVNFAKKSLAKVKSSKKSRAKAKRKRRVSKNLERKRSESENFASLSLRSRFKRKSRAN